MKRTAGILLALAIALTFMNIAYADGDPNIDGGGGGTEDGTSENFWSIGNDGVRVTIVRESDKTPVTAPVDFTNNNPPTDSYHFGKFSKISYSKGKSLQLLVNQTYEFINPVSPIPPIVSASGGTNIAAVKDYFCAKTNIEFIAEQTGFEYDKLISGQYVIMLEPIVYITLNSVKYAMTATEAALLDQVKNGDLKNKLGFITHQNLPLAMFLEKPDLGYPAWGGATSGIRANSEIISQLGIGTVRFTEGACCSHALDCPCIDKPSKPTECECKDKHPDVPCDPANPDCDCKPAENGGGTTGEGIDYEYRTDTDVITSVMVYNKSDIGIDPKKGASVTLNIDGVSHTKNDVVIPPNESQLIWVKWHTPAAQKKINISVSANGGISLDKVNIVANVSQLKEKTPPNTEGRDRNDNFSLKPTPDFGKNTTHEWGEWWAWWQENWVWEENWVDVGGSCSSDCEDSCSEDHSSWEDQGEWVDHGWWVYEYNSFTAQLWLMDTKLSPDARVPTEIKNGEHWEIKSGYGVNIAAKIKVTTNAGDRATTSIQNAVAVFPEFDYTQYNRLLVPKGSKYNYLEEWTFAKNDYSQFKNPVHFVPIWYPDNKKFEVAVAVFDAWTPIGQLYGTTSDYVMINGDVYDDWYTSPF